MPQNESRTRIIIELLVIAAFNLIAFFLFAEIDMIEALYKFAQEHEEYELDEILPLFITLTISFLIFGERRRQESVRLRRRLSKLSTRDYLTGLFNRRHLTEIASIEFERFNRGSTQLSLILIDLDDFKLINDTRGHLVGDEVLKLVSSFLQKSAREIDVIARWGGDEFLILCRDTSLDGANTLADKLLAGLRSIAHIEVAGITASLGVAAAAEGDTLDSLIHKADKLLYQAKSAGKNRVASEPLAN